MSEQQEMIRVQVGLKTWEAPKVSEPQIRRMYYGTPQEKILVITPVNAPADKAKLEKIINKLK